MTTVDIRTTNQPSEGSKAMQPKSQRIVRGISVVAILSLVVGACSAGSASSAPAASATISSEAPASAPAESAAASEKIGGTVSVLGPWGGEQTEQFKAVLAPFEERTGITVNYTGSQDLTNLIRTGVESGTPPDIADLPSPGILREYADAGSLLALDDILDASYKADTSPGVVDIGVVDGMTYGTFFLGSIKGLIWYDPKVYTGGEPTSWDDLAAKASTAAAAVQGGETKPWCVAVGSDAATGWPATDWIEDFLLRQSGPDAYDQWVAGTLKWSSPEVKRAFESYGSVVEDNDVYGGATTVLTTPFADGGNPLFTDPPGCLFHHQASWMSQLFMEKGGATAGDFDYYPFPDIDQAYSGSVIGAGDYMAVFKDTPQSRALIAYLATAEAQSVWVGLGGQLSGNKTVTNYPDELLARSGEVLANARTFRFDGSDLMPQAMLQAFWVGVLDYTKDQSTLDEVLSKLDEAQASAYGS
jgi:alpha-glucoside transport system substrate-binding protein